MKYFQVSSLRFVNFLMRISRFFVFYTVGNKYKGSEFDVFSNNKLPYELAKNVQMYFSDPFYSYMHLITTVCSAEWSTDWEHLLFNRKKNDKENKVFNFLPLLLLRPFFHFRDIADLLSNFNHVYKNQHLKNCLVGNVKPMIRLIERNFKQIQWRLLGDDSIKPYLYRIDRKAVDMTSSHCSFCQTEFLPTINTYIKIDDDTLHSDSKTHLKQFPKWIPKYCIMQTLVKTVVNNKIESKIMFLTDTGVWILKKESQNGGKKVDHTVNKGFLGGISGGFSGFNFGSTTSIATNSNASDGFSFNSDDFFHRWEYYMPLEILAKQNCTLRKSDDNKVSMDYAVTQDTVKKLIDAKKKEDGNSSRLTSESIPDLTVYEKYLKQVEIELPSKHMCKFFMGQVLRLECCDVIRMQLKVLKGAHLQNDTEVKDGYQSMDYIELESGVSVMTDNYIGISDYQTFPLKSDSESFDWTAISTKHLDGDNTATKTCEQIVFRDLIGSVTSKTIDEEERKHLTSMILYTWPALKSGKDGGYHDIIDTILLTLARCCTRLQEHRTWSLTILIIWLEKNGCLDIVTVSHLMRLKEELSGLDIKSSGLEDVIKSPYWEYYKLLDMIENFVKDKNDKMINAKTNADNCIEFEPENSENDTSLTPKTSSSMTPKTPTTSTPTSNRATNPSASKFPSNFPSKFPFEFNFEQKKHPLLFIEDAHKFALALTVHQQELLKNQIILTDLLLKTNQLTPALNLAMKFSEHLTYWLQSQLLSLKNFKERVKALDNAISILFELKALRNYMGLLDFKLGLFKYCSQLKLTFTEVFSRRSDSEKEFLSTLDCTKTVVDTMKLFKKEYQKMENLDDVKRGIMVVEHGDNLKKAVKDCAFIPMPYDIIPNILKAHDWKPEQRQEKDNQQRILLPISNDGTRYGNLKKSFKMYQLISPMVACYQQAYVADLDVDRFKFENSNAKFYQDIFKTIEITEEFEFQDNYKMIMDYVKNELGEQSGDVKPKEFPALYGDMVGLLANKLRPTNSSAPPPLPRKILTKQNSNQSASFVARVCDPSAPALPPKKLQNNFSPNSQGMKHVVQQTSVQRPQVAISKPRPPARLVHQPISPSNTLRQHTVNTNTAILNTVSRNPVPPPLVPSRDTTVQRTLTNTPSRAAPPPPPPRNTNSSIINTQTAEEIREISALHPDYMQLPDQNPEYRAFS